MSRPTKKAALKRAAPAVPPIPHDEFEAMMWALHDCAYEKDRPLTREMADKISDALHRTQVASLEQQARRGRRRRVPDEDLRTAHIASWLIEFEGVSAHEAMEAAIDAPIELDPSDAAKKLRRWLDQATDRTFPGWKAIYAARERLRKSKKRGIKKGSKRP